LNTMLFPKIAYATSHLGPAKQLVGKIGTAFLNPLISIIFGFAFILFIWGLVEYFWQSDSDEGRSRGARHVLYGLIGMVIMFGAFEIINIIAGTVGSSVDVNAFKR